MGFLLMGIALWNCQPNSTQQSDKPNILFAIMDDATFSHFSVNGCKWINTPNFDRVAREGILFNNTYTPNAKCAPSRACILTGRNSWQLEEAANHNCFFPAKYKTFAEVLVEQGYHVGYTGKGWAPGDAGEIDGKARELIGPRYNEIKLESPTSGISSIDYARNFTEFLNDKEQDNPFFFWFGSFEPHRAYEFGSGIEKGGKKLSDIQEVYSFWPKTDSVLTDLLDYAYEIEYFDQQLGKMLDELEERGELDNTLIVVTADNGMPFPRIKGQEYELSNHLPLAMMWANGIESKGRKVDDFVSFIDFAPTFLELAGIQQNGMQAIEGKSLSNLLLSNNSGQVEASRNHVLIGKERHDVGRPHDQGYPIRGIVNHDYLLVENFKADRWPAGNPETGYLNCDGSPTKTVCLEARHNTATEKYWQWSFGKRPEWELYNKVDDPECMHNLAENPAFADILEELKETMYSELKEQQDPRIMGNGDIFDEYVYAPENVRNFYERYMKGEKMNTGWVNPSDFESTEIH